MSSSKTPKADQKDTSNKQHLEDNLLEMPLDVKFVLGECHMEIADILRLGQGSIIELDTLVHNSLKLQVNDQVVASAESVVIHEKIGARITDIRSPEKRVKGLKIEP